MTASVATVAMIANSVVSWRTLANQRRLAREQRTWDAVRELYVDLLIMSEDLRKAVTVAEERDEELTWPIDDERGARLNAQIEAYASDRVRTLHQYRINAFTAHAGFRTERSYVNYGSAEFELRVRIREELGDIKRHGDKSTLRWIEWLYSPLKSQISAALHPSGGEAAAARRRSYAEGAYGRDSGLPDHDDTERERP